MKKKLWITSLLAALSITAVAGGVALANEQADVTAAAENWQVEGILNTYQYGTSFEVPAATVEIDGESVAATATVTYPNGLTVATENVPLNQAGIYTVTYRAVVGDAHYVEEKKFNVENSAYIMQNEHSSAEYGTYTGFGSNSQGLLVRLAPNDTLTFSEYIDVSNLTGLENLIELFVTPNAMASYDFSKLVITLTDSEDSSKYLRYQLKRYNAEDRGFSWGYLDVSVNGQPCIGYEKGYRLNGLGTPFNFTFNAAKTVNPSTGATSWTGEVREMRPDSATCRITYNPLTTETLVSGSHIANLNNPALVEDIWTGWPSGKAKVTIKAEEVKSDTANFCIKDVLGIDLTSATFTESDAPKVTVSMAQEDMPYGEVGYSYAIPTATAYDSYSGICDVNVGVYRDYASAMPISVSVVDGKFTPTVSGWHTIVYSAKDALGNEGKALLNVYVSSDLGDIEVTLPENIVTEAKLGSWVPVEEVSYTGDCGVADVKIVVTDSEGSYEITDGFLPETVGKYTVTYTVTDYIGRVGTAEYEVDAQIGDSYVLLNQEKLVLPQIFLSDVEYVLPEFYATDYTSGKAERVLCDVVVGDTTYKAGASFTPSVENNGDKVKISYQCDGNELWVKEVPTVIVKNEETIIAKNYLYGEGFTTSYKYQDNKGNTKFYTAGIEIIADADSERNGWTFATPQLMNDFEIMFEGLSDKTNFGALEITFTDSQNVNEQIKVTLTVKNNGTTITVGENSVDTADVSLKSNKTYTLSYSNGKVNFGGMNVTASKTVNGEDFTGFSSNLAYVKVEMVNAKAGAAYKLRTVCGSNISYRNLEVFAPNFQILGDFGGNQSINSTLEIFPAIANDVFAPETNLSMTVTAPDGSIIKDKEGVTLQNVATDKSYFITMSQYGKYEISYTAEEKDWIVSNTMNVTEAIFVIDEVEPQAKFIDATQTTATVGDTLVCPTVVYQDNVSANENIRILAGVYNPNGRYYRFEDGENAIVCRYAGDYKFIVMVFDEQGNMTCVTHTVTVTVAE